MITPIGRLTPIIGEEQAQNPASYGETQGVFQSVFQSAIDNVKQTDADVVEAEYLLATGQLDNPATLMIASTKSQIAVDLLVQLRNKALDAYSELTRISI